MKKILGMAGLLIAAVIFAYTFRLKTVGYLDTSVMAVTDRQMTGTLKAGIGDHEDRKLVTLQQYQAAEPLYSRGNRYYLGQEKTQLDISYPFYVNSGTSLYFMTDQTKLITSDFAVFDSYNGLFLSDGKAYTGQDGNTEQLVPADEEEYIMTSIGGGVYQNLQPMKVTSDSKEDDYRLNSFLYLDDKVIRAYSYEDDALVYTENPVSVSSRISIGSLNMSYSEFLGYLKTASGNSGEFTTGLDITRQGQESTGLNEERSHEEGERQTADSQIQQAPPAAPAVAGNGVAGADAASGNGQVMDAEGQNTEGDGSGSGVAIGEGSSSGAAGAGQTGDAGGSGNDSIGGDGGDTSGSGGGNGSGSGDSGSSGSSGGGAGSNGSGEGSSAGNGDINGGNHDSGSSGGNGNGGHQSGSGSGQGQGSGGNGSNTPEDGQFHEPKITMDAPEMGVYYLKSAIHIDDPDDRLVRVVIRAYLNGKQGGRKNLKSDADFKIQNLRPGETYEIKGEMVYRNANGVKETKAFMENIEVSTKPLSSLAPITLNFEDADTYATQSFTIRNMTLTGPSAKDENEEILLPYATRIRVIVKGFEDQDETLGSTLVRKMRQGEKINWTSGEDFKSNSSYDYSVVVEDRFGNQLQLTDNSRTTGHTRTCKTMPKAAMSELENVVGTQKVGVQLTNSDNVSMSNLRLKIIDLEGNVLPAFADGYYYPLNAGTVSQQEVNITMLPTGINIVAVVEADFDLGDKPKANLIKEREIGRIALYTAPISRLGSVYADITTADVTASSVDITFAINQNKTLEGLLELMTQARVLISAPDGTIVYNSMAGDGTHIGGVSQSSEMTSGKIQVGIKSNYLFDRERLSEGEWIKQADGSFQIQPSNSVSSIPQVKVMQPDGMTCENPWQALKNGGEVRLSFPRATDQFAGSFKSMTQYQITVQAVATQAGISHSVGYAANNGYFKTLRQAPVFEYSDAFTIANQYSIYGFRINDPDGTIPGGQVQMRVSNNGIVVMARSLETNTEPQDLVISDLHDGNTYLITFMTTLYNEGYDSTTQEVKTFSQRFGFTVGEDASGSIQLNGLGTNMKATLQVDMSGKNGELIGNQYQVEIYGAPGIDTNNAKVLQNQIKTLTESGLPMVMNGFTREYEYSCETNWKYIMRLVVNVRGYKVILDDVSFTTEGQITSITSWSDIKDSSGKVIQKGLYNQLNENPTGKFVVTKDIVKDNDQTAGSNNTIAFNGTIDFQGHTVSVKKTGTNSYAAKYMFNYLGSEGVIENLVFDWSWDNSVYSSNSSFYRWCPLVEWNYGTIRNVKVNIDMSGRQYISEISGMVHQNYASGVIENFVVSLNHEFYTTRCTGLVCYYNQGIVRNGYIYSGSTNGTSGITSGSGVYGGNPSADHQNVSGAVGYNHTSGLVENVFSLINLSIEKTKDGRTMDMIGGVVGWNSGTVRNSFWVGDIYSYEYDENKVQTASTLYRRGGGIVGGKSGTAKVENLYNISLQPDPIDYGMASETKRDRIYASTEPIQRLWDFVWYESVFSSSANYDVQEQLDAGYYPKLKMSEVMSGVQDDVKLPPSTGVNIPTYISNTIEEQGADWAVVKLYFNNPNLQEIRSMTVENLTAEILDQHSESSYYVVRVKLTDPKTFTSSYRLTGFQYRVTATSDNTAPGNPAETALIKVKMYKQIWEPGEWAQIGKDLSSNYQLEADLDFSGAVMDRIVIPGSFTGELDGNGHSISNLAPRGNSAYIFEKVSGGAIYDLDVNGMEFAINDSQQAKSGAVNAGFIGSAENGATLTNIRLSNVVLDGVPGAAGALAGKTDNITVTDCRAEQVTIVTAAYTGSALRIGGLLGETKDTPIENCYVSSLDLTAVQGFSSSGIGGLVGSSSGGGKINNAYVHGTMKTAFTSVGGAVGRSSTNVTKVWTMVDINSNMGQLGGIVGVMGTGAVQNTLVIGDLATSNTSGLGRIYGAKEGESSQVTLTNGIAASGQIYGSTSSGELKNTNVTGLTSAEELERVEVYRDQARLGNGFDLTGDVSGYAITSGYMPMIFGSDGTILAKQTPVLRKDGRLKITNVSMTENQDGTYTLMVQAATGDSSFKLVGVECDAFTLDGSSDVQDYGSNDLVGQRWMITYSKVTLRQYLSVYGLSVVFENKEGIRQKLSYQLTGNYYRRISSADEWVTVMSRYGQNFENFEITGDIDLSTVSQDLIESSNLANLKINSLRSTIGKQYKIHGMHYDAQVQGEAIIASLSGTMENITFEDMTISNMSMAVGGTNVGLIGQNNGTIQNVVFKRITVDGYNAKNVGCIGGNNGTVTNVTVQDVEISSDYKGGQYVGGLVGYSTGVISDIKAEGTQQGNNYKTYYNGSQTPSKSAYSYKVTGQLYTGGVIGYSTAVYSHIVIKAAYVEGTEDVGGISGYVDQTTVEDLVVGDRNDEAMPVYVTGSTKNIGGVVGLSSDAAGENIWRTIKNARVYNSYIKGSTYTGGILGNTGGWYMRIQDSEVVHADIRSNTNLGGITGNYCYNLRNRVEDCKIRGTSTIGGIEAASGAIGEEVTVVGCTIEGSGDKIGGIVGSHGNDSIRGAIVADCTVSGTTSSSKWIGGVAGTADRPIYNIDVIRTTVSGGTMVGGLAGRAEGHNYYRCSIDADVSATVSKAGGAFGELIGFNSTKTRTEQQKTSVYNFVVGGTVSSASMAGGFAGAYSITPALYDMNGEVKDSGSTALQSNQYYRITLMNKVTCTSDAVADQDTCSVWTYFTPYNSVKNLSAQEYKAAYRINGITQPDGTTTTPSGAVWSGVKVMDKNGTELHPLKTYLERNFQDWSKAKNVEDLKYKNVVVHIADLKDEDFWVVNQRMVNTTNFTASNYMIYGKVNGKYNSDVVKAGIAPFFHNNWATMMYQRDDSGNLNYAIDEKGNSYITNPTVNQLEFQNGSQTYTAIVNAAYVTKDFPVFYFPNSGDNLEWNKDTSTTTLTAGENLMVYASDVASLNLEVADEVVEAAAGAAALNGTDELVQADADPILLTVSDSQGVIFAAPVTQKVYTIPYDFSTTLTAELTQGDVVQEYEISARNLVHTVMNYDGDYYYMTGSGIRSSAWADDTTASKAKTTASGAAGKSGNAGQTAVSGAAGNSASAEQEETVVQGLCEGQFLNMWAGKALDVNGDVWDLASRTVEARSVVDRDAMAEKAEAVLNVASGQAVAAYSMDDAAGLDGTGHVNGTQDMVDAMKQLADIESQPLYQFQYGDTTLEVYGKDTISVKGGEENTLDSLIYVKNGYLYPVDNELDAVTGAILADAYGDNRYLSVLTGEGVIQDLGNDLTLPDGFKNCSIAELADNLASDSRVAIGRYKNGTAFAFDYITGKTIDLYEDEYDTGNDVGIFDYAKDWIVSKAGSWFGLNNSGYKGAQNMIAQYQQGGSNGILGQLRQMERTITTWKDGSDTTGTADGKDGTASGVDNTEGTDGTGMTGDAEQNGGLDQGKVSDQKDNTDLTDGSDTTAMDGDSNLTDNVEQKSNSDSATEEKNQKDIAEKTDTAANSETEKNTAETLEAEKTEESQAEISETAEEGGEERQDDGQNSENGSKDGTDQNVKDDQQSATSQKTEKDDQVAVDQKTESGSQTDAGQKVESGDQAVTGEKSESGDQAAAGQKAESGEQSVAGDEAAADGTETQQSQAKAKDQLVTIYNADTKSYEVYDVEDFLSNPKSEIATVSEKVKELTKQGLINNTTDLKAEDTLTDTNRYGIWIYCGIAAAILLLLGYLADRKRRQWK